MRRNCSLCAFLMAAAILVSHLFISGVPEPEGPLRPLPEDYAMRGLLWAEKYYPSGWFSNDNIEDDKKGLEAAHMGEERKVRVLDLGCRIARENKWLRYDSKTRQFSVSPEFDIKLD